MRNKSAFLLMALLLPCSVFSINRGPGFNNGGTRIIDRGNVPAPPSRVEYRESRGRSFSSVVELETSSSRGEVAKCDDGKTTPLNLLKLISINGNGVEIEHNIVNSAVPNDKKSITVTIPNHIQACSDFVPKVHQDQTRNNVFITVDNEYDFEKYLDGKPVIKQVGIKGDGTKKYSKDDIKKMSPLERYEACMTLEGIFVPKKEGKGITINWPQGKGYGPKYTKAIKVDFNPNEDMRVLFGSPIEGGNLYGAAYAWEENVPMAFNNPAKCLLKEEIVMGGINLWDDVDRKYAKLKADCEGGHLRIKNAMKRLSEFPEKDVFRKILEKQLENELEEMSEDRYKRMSDLGEKLRDPKIDRKRAEQLSSEYVSYVRELNNFYLTPKMEKLEKLMKQRETGGLSDVDKAKLDKEINTLNNQIASFDRGPLSKKMDVGKTMDALRKQGLVDEANEIAEFKINSSLFGRVYSQENKKETRGKKLSFNEAKDLAAAKAKVYRKDSEMFSKAYMAKMGEGKFSGHFLSNIKGLQQQSQTAIMKHRAKEMQYMRYCSRTMIGSVQNPIKCKKYMSGDAIAKRQRMLQSTLKSYEKKIALNHDYYQKFTGLEQEGAKKLKEAKEAGRTVAALNDTTDIDLGSSDPFTLDNINDNIVENDDSGLSLLNSPTPNTGLVNNPQMFPMSPMGNMYNMNPMMMNNYGGARMGAGFNFNSSF